MDLSTLDPKDIAELKEALSSYEPPEDPVKTLATIVDLLCQKLQEIEGTVAQHDDFINNGLIGGLQTLSAEQTKAQGISGLKGKYGSLFGAPETGAYLKDKIGDPDNIWELLYENLEQLKGQDGYTDEMGDKSVQEIAAEIGRRVAEITGKPAVVEATSEPAPEAKEAPKAEEKPAEKPAEEPKPDESGRIKGIISKIKERAGQAA